MKRKKKIKNIFNIITAWVRSLLIFRNICVFMATSLRGYSLFNCLAIQIALFGNDTAIIFTVIIEVAAMLIIFLISSKKTGVIVVLISTLFYLVFSFCLIMINEASLAYKIRMQETEIKESLYADFERLRKMLIDEQVKLKDEPESNIKGNDLAIDRTNSELRKQFLNKRNDGWESKLKVINTEISRLQRIKPNDIEDIRKYIQSWLPMVPNSAELMKSDMLYVYNDNPRNGAFRDSWGMSPDQAKKITSLAMAILVEILVFSFAIVPKLLSRKKKKGRKSKKKSTEKSTESQSQEEISADKELIVDIEPDTREVKSIDIKSKTKSINKKRNSIKSIDDLKSDMVRRFNESGRYPNVGYYSSKWRDDFYGLFSDLWPEVYKKKYGDKYEVEQI